MLLVSEPYSENHCLTWFCCLPGRAFREGQFCKSQRRVPIPNFSHLSPEALLRPLGSGSEASKLRCQNANDLGSRDIVAATWH